MDKLEEVSVSATKEHALEISLHEMIRQVREEQQDTDTTFLFSGVISPSSQ